MQYGVPKDYEGRQSTVPPGPETIAEGRKIYAKNCAACHGSNGLGNGEAAKALSPSPALLAYMIRRPIAVDEYLLWTISDGGKQFGSEMPAFKDKLSGDDIWRVVAYMRAGFPAADGPPKREALRRVGLAQRQDVGGNVADLLARQLDLSASAGAGRRCGRRSSPPSGRARWRSLEARHVGRHRGARRCRCRRCGSRCRALGDRVPGLGIGMYLSLHRGPGETHNRRDCEHGQSTAFCGAHLRLHVTSFLRAFPRTARPAGQD